MSQDLFLRDDIIELNNKLDSQCFNVKAYRKRKSKSKKVSVIGALTTDLGFSQQNILKTSNSLHKNQFSNNQISQRRISLTAGINKRADLSQNLKKFNQSLTMRTQRNSHKKSHLQNIKTGKIHNSSSIIKQQQHVNKILLSNQKQTARNNHIANTSSSNYQQHNIQPQFIIKNKYKQIEEKHNKNGPINDRAIQNWLNQILMEYCHQQHFDKSIQNAALKKMSIDRNSLLSQGINPQYVNRVYKSMFVYSIGFNNLLKQLSGKNTHLKKTIWKVYAILLQFCSQGTFETMIGQIQRDKAKKVQSLIQQIQKRQNIIQNNDQINEQKNGKIFKQLKILREQNKNLQNEKNVLLQDYKQAEQSFNQEVSLRLKFQNKINEIHGIHHQLSTKHNRLYEDYHKKVNQIQVIEHRYKQIAQKYLITKQKLHRMCQQLQSSKRDNIQLNELIQKYQQSRTRFENSQIQLRSSKQDLQNIIKQKSRKISQLQIQLQNSEIMLSLSKQSSKQLQQQYKQQLQQNKKLHTTIRDQINQLNQMFAQKKNFNEKHISYVAEIEFLKNKDSQNKIIIQKIKKEVKQRNQTNNQLLIDKIAIQKKVQTLNNDLSACFDNIQNMKITKNKYEEQLTYLKKKYQIHGYVVGQKDIIITTLTKTNQKLSKQNSQLIIHNKTLDSKATVLAQRLKSQQEINKKRFDKLKQQRDQLSKLNEQHDAILQNKIYQLEKYMSLYDKQMLDLKNQKFQRTNLDASYKQTLKVMQSQNQHIKNLNIKISQNYEQIQEWKRKQRNFQYILKEKQHLFEIQRNSLKSYLEQARSQVNKKKMFVNPMLLEDLKGLLKRAIQKYDTLLKQHNTKLKEFKIKQINLNSLIQTNNKTYLTQLSQEQTNSRKKYQEKQYQLEYQKDKSKHLQSKLQEFQKIINLNKYGAQNPNISKQKQKKYLATIKEKSQHIQKLLKQLESAHDHNNTLIKRISEIEDIIGKKNSQITEIQKKFTKLNQQHQALQKQKFPSNINGNRQKQTLSSKMDDYDQNLLGAMSNQNHLGISFQQQNPTRNPTRSSNTRQPSARSNIKITGGQEDVQERQDDMHLQIPNKDKVKQKTQKFPNPMWRNNFGKKLKNAFNYYQK